jgi:hypothetical protein
VDSVVRSLWLGRAWTTLPLLAFVWIVASAEGQPMAWLAAALGTVVSALACLTTAATARELVRGDRGEILMRNGARVPLRTLRLSFWADTAEMVVALASAAVLCVGTLASGSALAPLVGALGVLIVLLQLAVWIPRFWSHQMFEAVWSVTEGDLERAERALRTVEHSRMAVYQQAAARLRTQLLLRRGQPYTAEQQLERTWNGTLDDHGGQLAWLRLGADDRALAERWLATSRPDAHRYGRYMRALVASTLALCQQRWPEAVEHARSVTPEMLPRWYTAQLELVEVAALQGEGRTAEARALLGRTGPLEPHAWLASAQPMLWRLVQDAAQGRASEGSALPRRGPAPGSPRPPAQATGPSPDPDPFAPPTGPLRAAPSRSRFVGAFPVEGMALGSSQSAALVAVRLTLGVVLVCLGGLVAQLLALVYLLGGSSPGQEELGSGTMVFAAGVMAIGCGVAIEQLAGLLRAGAGPQMVLSDGRAVSRRWYPLWALATSTPQLSAACLIFGIPWLLSSLGGPAWGALLLVPLGGLLLWSGLLRVAAIRLVAALHFEQRELVRERVAEIAHRWLRHSGQARVCVALSSLWSGEPAEVEQAERQLEELAAAQALPQVTQVLGWFHAARGRVDLERALREPEPEPLGERYRWAVTLCLAALQAGRPELLLDRASSYERVASELPNRFGALLLHLVRRVRGDRSPIEADLAWIATVWPFAG